MVWLTLIHKLFKITEAKVHCSFNLRNIYHKGKPNWYLEYSQRETFRRQMTTNSKLLQYQHCLRLKNQQMHSVFGPRKDRWMIFSSCNNYSNAGHSFRSWKEQDLGGPTASTWCICPKKICVSDSFYEELSVPWLSNNSAFPEIFIINK